MRVLYCTDTYPPQINGVSIVTALSVAGLARRGWECTVVAPRYPAAVHAVWRGDPEAEAPITWLPSVALPGYSDIRLAVAGRSEVRQLVARFRPDLVHCETEFSAGRMGQRAAEAAGIPVVSSYHTDFGRYAEAYGVPWLRRTVTGYLTRFHRRSLRVYTPSAVAKADLVALGVEPVEVWGRGVDTEVFHPRRRSQELREALGMGSRFTFVYVGRLAAEKRVDVVLEAFRLAAALVPRGVIHLILAGTGPCEAALKASAPDGVTFLGFLDRRDALPDLYANCDAFVFSSLTETLACRARGDGERTAGDRRAGGRGPGPPSRRAQRGDLRGRRRRRDGARLGAAGQRVGVHAAAGAERPAHGRGAQLGPGAGSAGRELPRGVRGRAGARLRPGRRERRR